MFHGHAVYCRVFVFSKLNNYSVSNRSFAYTVGRGQRQALGLHQTEVSRPPSGPRDWWGS